MLKMDPRESRKRGVNSGLPVLSAIRGQFTYLVSETLLLEVETGRSVERSALGSGREDRSPRRESTLHVEQGRMKDSRRLRRRTADEKDNGSIPNTTSRARTGEEEEKDGRRGCEEGRRDGEREGDEAKVSKIFQAFLDSPDCLGGRSS
jgi:hypothetical protein